MGTTINPYGKDIIKVETEFLGRPVSLEVPTEPPPVDLISSRAGTCFPQAE